MNAPRVAIIRQKYNPSGGAERFVSRAIEALQGQGKAELWLLARDWIDTPGLRFVRLAPFHLGRTWRDWSFARAVCCYLRAESFDLVQSHERLSCCDIYRAGDGVHREWLQQRARRFGPLRKLAQALSLHHRYVLRAEERMFRNPALECVICISGMGSEEVRRHYKVPEDRIEVIYPGVDVDKFHPQLASEQRKSVRISLGIPEDAYVLVYAGSGFERKGVAPALRAVARSGLACHLLILGRDKRARRYRKLAQRLGLAERAHFLGAQGDVRPYYAAADVFIMPSIYEPFGNANMEAMAMGLPLITSTKSGAAELVRAASAGHVCEAFDVEAQARAIIALADPAARAAAGRAARTVAERHSLPKMIDRLAALYSRILAKRQGNSAILRSP
ncbi:MAG: glycosyltransferase family 4 protein [Burkholderiales bacterium]